MPKIALSMIVKDDSEAENLRRCLNSIAKYVDAIYLTITNYPYREIEKLAKEYGATVSITSPATTPDVYKISTSKSDWEFIQNRYNEKLPPYKVWKKKVESGLKAGDSRLVDKDTWLTSRFSDFSAARNFAFSQVPKDKYEWIFWLDCDDVLVGGETLHDAATLAENNNIKAVFARYLYQVDLDESGKIKNILIEHLRERLIRNDGSFEWVAPIHETLIEKVPSGKTDYQGFYVVHLTTYDEMVNSMHRNIEILENEVIQNPQDPRPIYYLAKAYFDTRDPMLLYEPVGEDLESLTIELIKDYIRKSGWPEERAQAYEYLSMIYREMNDYKKAISALLEAEREWPEFPSIYIQLALCYVVMSDWSKALHWVKVASQVEIPKTTLVINPRDYKTMILEALFHIYINTGKLDETVKVCQGLVDIAPTELNQQRLKEILDLKHRNNLAHWTVKLAHHLKLTGQVEQLKALINSIPQEIVNEPTLVNLRNDYLPAKVWEENEVAIYCGPGFEHWSPKSVAKGIGGSEEAVINMSRELAKLGWKVTVFAEPGADEGEHDRVNYVPHYHVNWKDQFNILISWRQIGLFDIPVKARKTYLWNHDIQNPLTYTKERADKIDKVMFLSKWHRSNVPDLAEDKVMYTGNGISI